MDMRIVGQIPPVVPQTLVELEQMSSKALQPLGIDRRFALEPYLRSEVVRLALKKMGRVNVTSKCHFGF